MERKIIRIREYEKENRLSQGLIENGDLERGVKKLERRRRENIWRS